MAEATYKVTLPFNFLADSRTRGGITIPRDGGYEGPLTSDELKEIEADDQLIVEQTSEATPPVPTKAEMLASAAEEGLELTVTANNTVAQIKEAIDTARQAKIEADDARVKADAEAQAVAAKAAADAAAAGSDEVVDGIRYSQDGDKVMAVNAETFVNLQESPAGFGESREAAFADLQTKTA